MCVFVPLSLSLSFNESRERELVYIISISAIKKFHIKQESLSCILSLSYSHMKPFFNGRIHLRKKRVSYMSKRYMQLKIYAAKDILYELLLYGLAQ